MVNVVQKKREQIPTKNGECCAEEERTDPDKNGECCAKEERTDQD